MRPSTDILISGALPGAAAGLVAGAVFGLAMLDIGLLPSIAQLVREDSDAVGFIVHMAVALLLGSAFGVLVWRQRPGVGETLFWGLAYGTFWWYLGPLTLLPLFSGDGLTWDLPAAQDSLPASLGHMLYGISAGLAIVSRRPDGRTATGTACASPQTACGFLFRSSTTPGTGSDRTWRRSCRRNSPTSAWKCGHRSSSGIRSSSRSPRRSSGTSTVWSWDLSHSSSSTLVISVSIAYRFRKRLIRPGFEQNQSIFRAARHFNAGLPG